MYVQQLLVTENVAFGRDMSMGSLGDEDEREEGELPPDAPSTSGSNPPAGSAPVMHEQPAAVALQPPVTVLKPNGLLLSVSRKLPQKAAQSRGPPLPAHLAPVAGRSSLPGMAARPHQQNPQLSATGSKRLISVAQAASGSGKDAFLGALADDLRDVFRLTEAVALPEAIRSGS